MGSDSASEPPIKRLRTTETSSPSRSSVCAICFNDDGISCRGEIDCCDHYFCFCCIMEWSKTESRCPVCRRRFSTIRRPGVFSGDRMISVTHTDQAFEANNVNLYTEISCTVCHGPVNDYQMLFCKLCESASHMSCATAPEGDWFCPHCSVFCAESEEQEEEEEEEEDWPASYVLSRLQAKRKPAKKKQRESSGWVRMLRQSRNMRSRVRAVGGHWDSLRSGDLSLPSSSSDEPPRTEIKRAASREEEASTSTSAPSADRQVLRDPHSFISYDVGRAWKMFAMAKPYVKSRTSGIKIASEASGSRSFLPTVGFPKSVHRNVNEASSSANASTTSISGISYARSVPYESVGFHKERGHDSMKSEIQSLVKLNLKLLDRDKRLGVDSFKKMAQIATHTVMASCGLDHNKKYAILSFQCLACSHVELPPRRVSKFDPIPTCQKCLNSFVKNVVQSIMFEKYPLKRRSSEQISSYL